MTNSNNYLFGQAYNFLKNDDLDGFKKALIENRMEITQTNKDGYSFIHAALESDNPETVRHILDMYPENTADEASLKEEIITHALIHVVNPKLIQRLPINRNIFDTFTNECIRITRKSTELRFPSTANDPEPL